MYPLECNCCVAKKQNKNDAQFEAKAAALHPTVKKENTICMIKL